MSHVRVDPVLLGSRVLIRPPPDVVQTWPMSRSALFLLNLQHTISVSASLVLVLVLSHVSTSVLSALLLAEQSGHVIDSFLVSESLTWTGSMTRTCWGLRRRTLDFQPWNWWSHRKTFRWRFLDGKRNEKTLTRLEPEPKPARTVFKKDSNQWINWLFNCENSDVDHNQRQRTRRYDQNWNQSLEKWVEWIRQFI